MLTSHNYRELRLRDNTKHNVQLCIAIFCMLVVFAAGIEQTEPYAGCVAVSVLIHYFSLVAVMWMGAEAALMFQKLVIIFGEITTSYMIVVSLICWGMFCRYVTFLNLTIMLVFVVVPLVPVLVTLTIDVVNGNDPDTDLVTTRFYHNSTGELSGL